MSNITKISGPKASVTKLPSDSQLPSKKNPFFEIRTMLAPSSEKLEGRLVFNSIEAGRHHGRCRLEEDLELIVRKLGPD